MTTELLAQLTKLTKRQKLHLADQLLAEAGAHRKARLERRGWRVGAAAEFLKLNRKDAKSVERKLVGKE